MPTMIDIDTALKNKLTQVYAGQNVLLAFENSWGELVKETFPEITILMYDLQTDLHRFAGEFYRIQRTTSENKIVVDINRSPLPVDLFYQIDIYTRKMRQDREFSALMYGAFGIHHNFIIDSNNSCLMDFLNFVNLDFNLSGRPVYRKAFRYKIRTRLDVMPALVKVVPSTIETVITIKNK